MQSPPNTAEAHKARGVELRRLGRLDEALAELQIAIQLRPNYPAAYYNLAAIRRQQGSVSEAIKLWRKAIELKKDYFEAYLSLGSALRQKGNLEEALLACKQAVQIKPDSAAAHVDLGSVFYTRSRLKDAAAELEQAIQLDPQSARAHLIYANLLLDLSQPAKAVEHYRISLAIDPKAAEIHSNLGNVLRKQGRIDEAIACYEKTLALKPQAWEVHSNLLLTMNFRSQADGSLLDEHLNWAKIHAEEFCPQSPIVFANDCSPDRRLRIGYVSPDFRQHSVAYFFEPILETHDRSVVEVFCYSNVRRPDDRTRWMRDRADGWQDIMGLSDEQADLLIRQDRIDVLVDLAGHTGNHRLLLFARKPAPVQVTYCGYPNTTGLATMDYRLTDAEADPAGMTDSHYTEKLVRLPGGFLCFRPLENSPPPRDVESTASSTVTFGSFNNFAKVTPQIIELWSRILSAVPGSNLLLKADGLADEQTCQETRNHFIKHGINGERIALLGREPSFTKHLETYHRIDIGLDTFPYHGTATTCEAMWMGVPVITLAGKAHVSRVGVSLLTQVGLPELIAQSPTEYVELAIELAKDTSRRRQIASSLRQRMQNSPLMNASSLTQALEAAYRRTWYNYVVTAPAES